MRFLETFENHTQFSIKDREDDTYITAYNGAKIYGSVVLSWITAGGYEYEFTEDMSEDEFEELFPEDEFVKLVELKVDRRYRGSGHAIELMNKTLSIIKERGFNRVYLNANPIDSGGLDLNGLVSFYRKFGFEIIKSLDKWPNNKEMILRL
jgi:ribosomal protein S18 acetylase RimI-like enzyme